MDFLTATTENLDLIALGIVLLIFGAAYCFRGDAPPRDDDDDSDDDGGGAPPGVAEKARVIPFVKSPSYPRMLFAA